MKNETSFRNLGIVFLHISYLLMALSLMSCEKEKITYSDFYLKLNGELVSPGAVGNQIITNGEKFLNLQSDPNSVSNQRFIISNLPDIKQKTEISANDLDFQLHIFDANPLKSQKYLPIEGKLVLLPSNEEVTEGSFDLKLVNETNPSDTLIISEGYFKISFTTYWVNLIE